MVNLHSERSGILMMENKKLHMSVEKEGYESALAIKDDP